MTELEQITRKKRVRAGHKGSVKRILAEVRDTAVADVEGETRNSD